MLTALFSDCFRARTSGGFSLGPFRCAETRRSPQAPLRLKFPNPTQLWQLILILPLLQTAGLLGFAAESTHSLPEIEQATKKLKAAPSFRIELFAAEPLLANPTSFAFDDSGRVYVVETHRRRSSVIDIRQHPNWLDADLSFRSVQDRSNFFAKILLPDNDTLPKAIQVDRNGDGRFDFNDLAVESERIRLLQDRNGDGRADESLTFADGFNTIISGVAAGVLVRGANVWFASIPDLWLLQDSDRDGRADLRQSLLHGFGVHMSFGGHDLHGLIIGPDGKLYFSIGDRGLNVKTETGRVSYPDSGAVLRCNPDGTELELVATGLRNPQELAFDQFGNLWTGDNNGDAGDKARWVYVVEGSDSGWHIGWQHLPKLGPWNSEKLWELHPVNTAAYILPPVAHLGHGPAGIAFYPGSGLPARYQNHFFLCDFPGGVHSFALQPKGAAYEVVDLHEVLWNLSPVDVAFGPHGGVYVLDWTEGWDKTGKGRIYRIADPTAIADASTQETKKLLAEGMGNRSPRDLVRLLEHRDMRIRLESQFALVDRGATNQLIRAALKHESQLARLHALWGLGQIGRTNHTSLPSLMPLLEDPDAEVRGQTAKILGETRFTDATDTLVPLLFDPVPRVQFFAAMALGKLGRTDVTEPIFQMLSANQDRDPFLRHAGVMALVRLKDINALAAAAKDPSPAIRLGALLALRKLERPELAMFLYDSNTNLVLEAARAIYDLPIESALSQLANLASNPFHPEPIIRRAINAHFRLGKLENALALSELARRHDAPDSPRIEALQRLAQWASPPLRDPFHGLWRPLAPRDTRGVAISLRSDLPKILSEAPNPVKQAAIQTAVQLQITQTTTALHTVLRDHNSSGLVRAQALQALVRFMDPHLDDAITEALIDPDERVRAEAARLQAELHPNSALTQIAKALEQGSIHEKQNALQAVGTMKDSIADQIILAWLENFKAGQVPKELQLDLIEAASARNSPNIQTKLAEISSSRPKDDLLAKYREVLHGGDASRGKKIFFERVETSCARCHKVHGEGGEVGPELAGLGTSVSREYLLESILAPNKTIAPGYETLVVTLKSGTTYAGLVKKETDTELLLNSPEDGLVLISKDQVQSRDHGLSSMPTDVGALLSKRELRDLIEFLASLKTKEPAFK